jgi:hypothetical protein
MRGIETVVRAVGGNRVTRCACHGTNPLDIGDVLDYHLKREILAQKLAHTGDPRVNDS